LISATCCRPDGAIAERHSHLSKGTVGALGFVPLPFHGRG
jgi:hypothetical protein